MIDCSAMKQNKRVPTFCEKVLQVVRMIPKGKVMTYAAVARMAGSPHASRAVGTIMRKNYDATVPCHRVVCSNGSVGEYNRGGGEVKLDILKKEGVIFRDRLHVVV